jgi:MFS transporter, ACS family, hexuronate transporter
MTDRSPAWTWGVCGLLLLATMLNYMDRQTLSQMATDIGRELRLSNEDYGKLELGFGLAFAAGGVVTGILVDRFGVRLFYPALVLAWSAAGFATAWADSFASLLACRVLLGFFEAARRIPDEDPPWFMGSADGAAGALSRIVAPGFLRAKCEAKHYS